MPRAREPGYENSGPALNRFPTTPLQPDMSAIAAADRSMLSGRIQPQ